MVKRIDREPSTFDQSGKEVRPSPRLNLTTIEDVRRELARVYRDARSGKIEASNATRLAYILDLMRKMIETSDLEKRIAALEAVGRET